MTAFNEQTFNGPPTQTRRILRQVSAPSAELTSSRAETRSGRTRTVFGASVEDFSKTSTVEAPAPLRSKTLTGYFGAVRAAQVAHQHRVDFWGQTGVAATVAASPLPDPSAETLDAQYSDLQAAAYMPDSLQPSRSEFDDLARPQRRVAVVTAAATKMGITNTSEVTALPAETVTLPTIAGLPFAETLQRTCGARSGIRSGAALAFTAEQLREI
jgi:hypothetical protein